MINFWLCIRFCLRQPLGML